MVGGPNVHWRVTLQRQLRTWVHGEISARQRRLIGINGHLVEEFIYRSAQGRERGHRCREILALERFGGA